LSDSVWLGARDSPRFQNRRFQFQKRGQLFVRTHNKTLSIAAICVSNPNRPPPESIADTQPQVHPALLRLTALILSIACKQDDDNQFSDAYSLARLSFRA